jgi:DNA modification methylase
MVTDPPYGVGYEPAWRAEFHPTRSYRTAPIAGDDRRDWTEAYRLFPGDVAYVWHAGLFAADVERHLAACRFKVRAQIVWAKHRPVFSRGHYHWQHEPCFYAVRQGATASWAVRRAFLGPRRCAVGSLSTWHPAPNQNPPSTPTRLRRWSCTP